MTKKQLMEMGLDEATADKVVAAWNSELNGKFVPKERLDEKIAELKSANEAIAQRDSQIKKLGETAGDNEALKAQIADLKKQNEVDAQKREAELKATRIKLAAVSSLSDAQDADLVYSQLDATKITLDEKGKISGLKEQVEELKKTKPFLFKTDAQDGKGSKGQGLGIVIKGAGEGNPAPQTQKPTVSSGQAIAKLLARQKSSAEKSVSNASASYWGTGSANK